MNFVPYHVQNWREIRICSNLIFFSSSCISEFFDAREYATDDGVPSEYSSDEDIGSEGENDDISEDDEEMFEEAPPPNSLSTEFESLENTPSLTEQNKIENVSCTLTRITGKIFKSMELSISTEIDLNRHI